MHVLEHPKNLGEPSTGRRVIGRLQIGHGESDYHSLLGAWIGPVEPDEIEFELPELIVAHPADSGDPTDQLAATHELSPCEPCAIPGSGGNGSIYRSTAAPH